MYQYYNVPCSVCLFSHNSAVQLFLSSFVPAISIPNIVPKRSKPFCGQISTMLIPYYPLYHEPPVHGTHCMAHGTYSVVTVMQQSVGK